MATKHRAINGGNDAYFTKPEVAKTCVDFLKETLKENHIRYQNIIEPSAGNGSFLQHLPKTAIAYDLEPKNDKIVNSNWFNVTIKSGSIVVGNPPFGFAGALAVKFFNHAAIQQANSIAFIVPKSFKKVSIQNKLNPYYHLVNQFDLPKNSFLVDGVEYDVPCCFQVWVRCDHEREAEEVHNDLIEFTIKDKATFSVRRVGGRAGQVLEGTDYSESSTYFCRELKQGVKSALKKIDLSIVNDTAGVRSISKPEIVKLLKEVYAV